jgi:hypothetical protein
VENKSMVQSTETLYQFYLTRPAYKRTCRLAWLLCAAFGICVLIGISGGLLLWPTYTHGFTPYLKWQDALVGSSWCVALVSLGGCILVLRFLYALRCGYKCGMITLQNGTALTGRDLSPKNLISIFWAVATTFACFVVMLVGLAPAVLIGWTLHLTDPALLILATIAACVLSLGGLALSLPFGIFFLIGLICGISFCRKMGAPQTYVMNNQTTLRIGGFVLAIIHPDKPETLFDLQLLLPTDQQQLLSLLLAHWQEAKDSRNTSLGDEIEAALRKAEKQVVSA